MNPRRVARALPVVAVLLTLIVSPVVAQSEPASSPGASAGPTIVVTAHEYYFGDLPTTVPAGTSLGLTNQGAEVHELILARKNDGVTESWDEIIALPPEEGLSKVTTWGPLLAAPGEAAAFGIGPTGPVPMSALTLDQEGEYIAICFIPQGTTELPDFGAAASPTPSPASASTPPQGLPHFVLGMRQEFTVTAVGSSPGPVPSVPPSSETPPESPAG